MVVWIVDAVGLPEEPEGRLNATLEGVLDDVRGALTRWPSCVVVVRQVFMNDADFEALKDLPALGTTRRGKR